MAYLLTVTVAREMGLTFAENFEGILK
jgi:hypothetical protein